MIPTWSVRARKAKAVFYRQWNDIDIFIEDTGKASRKIVRQIFSRCFKDKYNVAEVFPLAGRHSVIQACSSDQNDGGQPRIYLIDGDLDLILDNSEPPLKRLFSLPIYCIENLLIDESAVIEVLYEEDRSAEHSELESKLDFQSWIDSVGSLLVDLFVDYAICKEVAPAIETVGFNVTKLVSSANGLIDDFKVHTRSKFIIDQILNKTTREDYAERRAKIIKSLKLRKMFDAITIVSGKDYLLPLLRMRMRSVCKTRANNDTLNIRLAKYCDTSALATIVTTCESVIAASGPPP